MSNQNVLFICLVIIVAALVAEYAKKPKKGEEVAMLSECDDTVITKVTMINDNTVTGFDPNMNPSAVGYPLGHENVTGNYNVAIGYKELVANKTGMYCTPIPIDAKIKTVPEKIDSFINKFGQKVFVKTWSTGNTSAWGE